MRRKVAIVTGANSGIGFHTAKYLATLNYNVILACRDFQKGSLAKEVIEKDVVGSDIYLMCLDLSSFDSIREFASRVTAAYSAVDLLVNNAGVMLPPRQITENGFELQLGVNYLSHFLITGLLLPLLLNAEHSRIVNVSSLVHKWGKIHFDDINFSRGYHSGLAYRQSKLACLLFSYELQRRLLFAEYKCKSIAAHPGISATALSRNLPAALQSIFHYISQPPELGAESIIKASIDESLIGGEYLGPGGIFGISGKPTVQKSSSLSYSIDVARNLWHLSEQMTGFTYKL